MKFAEKKQAYQNLQDPAHLKFDRELLEKKAPKSPALTIGMVDKTKAQREILWALLDVATVEEIKANRITPEDIYRMKFAEQFKAIQVESISGKLSKAELILLQDKLLNLLSAGDTPDEFKMEVHALKGFLESEIAFHELNEKLLTVDFSVIKQPEAAALARKLKFQPENFKLETLKPLLQDYVANLPKESEGTGEEMTEVPTGEDLTSEGSKSESHSDQVIDQMNEEKEELAAKVDELELENEDLQEQLEDAEAKKELLEEQLDEEKKSEATPDPA